MRDVREKKHRKHLSPVRLVSARWYPSISLWRWPLISDGAASKIHEKKNMFIILWVAVALNCALPYKLPGILSENQFLNIIRRYLKHVYDSEKTRRTITGYLQYYCVFCRKRSFALTENRGSKILQYYSISYGNSNLFIFSEKKN